MIVTAGTIAALADPWATAYNDNTVLQVGVVFLHLAGILFGGGAAVAMDRAAFRASREGGAAGVHHLAELGASHRVVLTGLAVTIVSGLLLFLADVETYFGSAVYWTKMALFVVLLANGWMMQRTERRLAGNGADPSAWATLRRQAAISLVLWFAVLLGGVAVVNAS